MQIHYLPLRGHYRISLPTGQSCPNISTVLPFIALAHYFYCYTSNLQCILQCSFLTKNCATISISPNKESPRVSSVQQMKLWGLSFRKNECVTIRSSGSCAFHPVLDHAAELIGSMAVVVKSWNRKVRLRIQSPRFHPIQGPDGRFP